jgi:hypothetical protein
VHEGHCVALVVVAPFLRPANYIKDFGAGDVVTRGRVAGVEYIDAETRGINFPTAVSLIDRLDIHAATVGQIEQTTPWFGSAPSICPLADLSEQFDGARRAVEAVGGGAEAAAEDAAAGDGQFDRELQQVGVEEYFVVVDAADGVAVELSALGASIN